MKDLIVLGMGASRRLCPFDAEVWNCNIGYLQIAEMEGHLNKIFMSHCQHVRRDRKGLAYNFESMNKLVDAGVEIINTHKCKGLKSKLYPLKRISKKFHTEYYSNTISYMLAYALDRWTIVDEGKVVLQEPKEHHRLRLYGIDMLTKDEYELEKGGIEFWLGYALGLGVEIQISEGSSVCKTCTGAPYGKKFYKMKEIDPWGLLKTGRDGLWRGQTGLTTGQVDKAKRQMIKDTAGIVKIRKRKGRIELTIDKKVERLNEAQIIEMARQ